MFPKHTHTQRLARGLGLIGMIGLLTLGGAAAQAQSASPIGVRDTPDLGPILTDQDGRTLYLYTKDSPGTSTCYDQCAVNWPPLLTDGQPALPDGLPGVVGTAERTDGSQQVTYNGMPLYYWIADKQPGDTTGQNVGGVWFVVSPAAPEADASGQNSAGY